MKHLLPLSLAALLLAVTPTLGAGESALDTGFTTPAQEDRPRVWWDWMNGSISKEGIKADLEDMHKVGIGGLQVRQVDPKFPKGPVIYGSDKWYDYFHYAMQTAADNKLDFGMNSSPGWSGNGGPWVKVEDSMKKVTWSTVENVEGHVHQKLPDPPRNFDFYRDTFVLAVPADPAPLAIPAITSSIPDLKTGLLVDGKTGPDSAVTLTKKAADWVLTYTYPDTIEARNFNIIALFDRGAKISLNGAIESSADGTTFRKIRSFSFPGQLQAHKGFQGEDVNINVPIEPTKAKIFRVTFKGEISPLGIAELNFSDRYRLENSNTKILNSPAGTLVPASKLPVDDPAATPLDKVVDLTASMKPDGTLDWNAPAGTWTILRIGYTTTGIPNHPAPEEGTGYEVDKMDAGAVDRAFHNCLDRVLREAGPLKGTTFTNLITDSWEAGQQNWCVDFATQFQKRRGYDLKPYLPVLTGRVVGSQAESEAFLIDFRRTCSDLMDDNYFAEMTRLTNGQGLRFYAECYGGKAYNEFQAAAHVDVNMSEFWFKLDRDAYTVAGIKRVASVAHARGKNLVAAESFTAVAQEASFVANPYLLKAIGDLAFANGLTQIYLHSYTHQPFEGVAPGLSMGSCGCNFGRLVTWWPKAGAWLDYLTRCQHLLKQGKSVSDIVLVRSPEAGSFLNDKFPDVPVGFDYDLVDSGFLLKASAANGVVSLPEGASYRVVVLPKLWWSDLDFLKQLDAFVKAGVPVIGPPPYCPGSLNALKNKAEWQALVDQLWPKDGNGGISQAEDFPKFLADHKIEPDCLTTPGEVDGPLNYIHRSSPDAEIYFLCNKNAAPLSFRADFRVANKQPELWDAVTGKIMPMPVFLSAAGRTAMDLTLPDSGSLFVIFRHARPASWTESLTTPDNTPASYDRDYDLDSHGTIFPLKSGVYHARSNTGQDTAITAAAPPAPLPVNSKWNVVFQALQGASFTRDFDKLESWADSTDETVKYFSGTGAYKTEINVPKESLIPGQRVLLDLGEVHDLAHVRINGKDVATVWTAPYSVDITAQVVPGRNTVEIEVTNRWVNRLMGDYKLPQDVVYQNKPSKGPSWGIIESFPDWIGNPDKEKARQRSTFVTYATSYKPQDKVPASGLIGPVQVQFQGPVNLLTTKP